jgi:hypothetical protein
VRRRRRSGPTGEARQAWQAGQAGGSRAAAWTAQKNEINRKISELLTLLMSSPEYQLT